MVRLKNNMMLSCTAIAIALAVASACAQSAALASGTSGLAWSIPATRSDLTEKASRYFSSDPTHGADGNGTAALATATVGSTAGPLINSTSMQFNRTLGGIPDPELTLAGGKKLFGACEPHNCVGNKVFLVTDATGAMVQAAGFLGNRCGPGRVPEPGHVLNPGCDALPTLTIYYADRTSRNADLTMDIIAWARQKSASNPQANTFLTEEKFVH